MTPYFQNDAVTLYRGDCLEVMPFLPGVDAVICDPPYGTTSCAWDAVIPFPPMWVELKRVLKPSGVIALFGSQPFSSALVMSNPSMFRHEWVWLKNRGSNFANTVREPMKEHEVVLIFSAGKWTYNKQMQQRTGAGLDRVKYDLNYRSKSKNYGDFQGREGEKPPAMRVPSSWQKFNTDTGGLHSTAKPVNLLRYLIRTYTNEGETVLDFTCGSGTTLLAAAIEGRKAIGIERNEKDCEVAKSRIVKHAAQEALSFE